jgi:hypothetical protein
MKIENRPKCECRAADANSGQKILKNFYFLFFNMSIHQSMQNCEANRLKCNVSEFFGIVFTLFKKIYLSDRGSNLSRSKKAVVIIFLSLSSCL